jgi:hypothetical protein
VITSRVCVWLVALSAVALAAPAKVSISEATKSAAVKIAAARTAKLKSTETTRALKAAFKELKPFVSATRKRIKSGKTTTREVRDFAAKLNELLTVSKMHGVSHPAKYICWSRTLARQRLLVEVPVSRHWKIKYHSRDQHVATVTQTRPNGKPLRVMKVWRYKWNTIYSGVGGENCKKLAEVILEQDRLEAKLAGGKASSKVRVKKLSTEFKRAYWYEVKLFDSDLDANVRRREIYIKGVSATINLEIVDHWSSQPGDDAVTAFQMKGDGPEIMHLLKSLKLNR